MIFEKEQANRYIRHTIIPEISGMGQKKLLESSVLVYGTSVEQVSILLYYLAASGIGNIHCYFQDSSGCESIFNSVHDLNGDTSVHLLDSPLSLDSVDTPKDILRIFICEKDTNNDEFVSVLSRSDFIPTIIGVVNGWKSTVKVFRDYDTLEKLLQKLSDCHIPGKPSPYNDIRNLPGRMLSAYLLSCIICIECIKFYLSLGTCLEEFLYLDLLNMDFNKSEQMKDMQGLEAGSSLSSGKKLSECSVLIVGTGGLGSPAAFGLAKTGIGCLGLVDYDKVDISNLNRQILHSTSRIGLSKVKSAEIFLKELNPGIKLLTYDVPFTKENALDIMKYYDIVIDGVDNLETRYLLNDTCYFNKKTMIEAGVLRFDGLCMSIAPERGPCYRCVFPKVPGPGTYPSCSELGILGPVPGVLGFIEASEAIKKLLGIGKPLENRLLLYDGLEADFRVCSVNKSKSCPLCGQNPSITGLEKYDIEC